MGVKELIIIAQDSTFYGIDIYGKRQISELLNRLSTIKGIEWIRLHYAFPYQFPLDLMETIASNSKICSYLDIPFQHISDVVLKSMHRGITKAETYELIRQLRTKIPNLTLRTTLLVGHPGEGQTEFDELCAFVKEIKFDRLGVFPYSEEEGTFAAENYKDMLTTEEKIRRAGIIMVRMAQDWSLRYPLVDGQGNFGSVDGDSPAAMRYTEARLKKIAEESLADIDKNTVDFRLNFDDSLEEPTVLPTRIPMLLVNGASGIAVGMATNMAPHNLGEVVDATCAYIDNRDITIEEMLKYVKGPDFPTGGIIYGYQGVKEAFETGRGRIVIRAKTELEFTDSGRAKIIVNEIPYMYFPQIDKRKVFLL